MQLNVLNSEFIVCLTIYCTFEYDKMSEIRQKYKQTCITNNNSSSTRASRPKRRKRMFNALEFNNPTSYAFFQSRLPRDYSHVFGYTAGV